MEIDEEEEDETILLELGIELVVMELVLVIEEDNKVVLLPC